MSSRPSPRIQNRDAVIRAIAERRVEVETQPFEIQYSGEHRCNLRCIQCGATVERNHGIEPLMDQRLPQRSFERFQKIAHGLPAWEWLSLTGSGETLINPELPQILEALQVEHECTVGFNTNGTLWTEERAAMVVKAGVSEVRFSMDGATKETFERIRVNARFEKVLNAVRLLRDVRDSLGATNPKISFSCNFMRQNIEELPMLVDLAKELGATKVIANNTIMFDPAMADEALVHHRELTDRMAVEAEARAAELGVEFVSHLIDAGMEGDEVEAPKASEPREPAVAEAAPVAPVEAAPVEKAPEPAPAEEAAPVEEPVIETPVVEEIPEPSEPPVEEAPAEPRSFDSYRPESDCGTDKLDDSESQAESILPPLEGLPEDLPPIVQACQRPWTGLYVENNGWAKVCCFDAPPIGNLDEQSFEEVWNGPLAQELRRSFLEDRPPEGCRNCFIFSSHKPSEDVFVQPMTEGRCYIDAPGLDPDISGTCIVHGWAISKDRVTRVEILIDEEHYADATYGHERPDVAEAMPGFPEGAQCGFRYDLDSSALEPGEHRLSIRVHDGAGGVQEGPIRVVRCSVPAS